jgi:hypothetical protein
MAIPVVDQFGAFISSLGFDPATTVIMMSLGLAVLPAARRGVLDNRLEDVMESVDYGLAILSTGFILALYYQYGLIGVKEELLGITAGFVLGTFVVRTLQKLTSVK